MSHASDNVDRITQRRAQRKRKQKRNWAIKVIAAALFLYLLLSVIFSFYSRMSTTIALKGTVEEVLEAEGYVFRNQALIPAPVDGHLESRVPDGERVNEGQTVAYMYTGEYDEERSSKIRELYDKIEQLESTSEIANTYTGNGVMVEQKIALAARDLSDLRQLRDMSVTAEHQEYLNLLIEKKHAMNSGGTIDVTAELNDYKRQLEDLENAAGGTKFALKAPIGGVLSYKIDGMEDKLSADKLEGINVQYLKDLDKEKLQHKDTIVANEPVCKVIDNYGWYFVTRISAKTAENLQVGKNVQMQFADLSDTRVVGSIRAISQEQDGEVAVTIYTNRYVEGIYSSSKVLAKLLITSEEGIKLPVESIHVKDGQPGVYVLRLDVARFVPVNVKYNNGTWAIVSGVNDSTLQYKLQIYDEVIVEAKNLEDGKVVR